MPKAAQVAVSGAAFNFDKLYTYSVPSHLEEKIQVGSIVLVPFGRSDSARTGVCLAVSDEAAQTDKKVKEIYDCTPEKACLTDDLLSLVYFLKQRTFCSYYEAVRAIIPYGAQYKPQIENGKHILKKQLVQQTERCYRISDENIDAVKLTKKQSEVIAFLKSGEADDEKTILSRCGITKAVLGTLCKNGVISEYRRDKEYQEPFLKHEAANVDLPYLSAAQQQAYNGIIKLMNNNKSSVALLNGVTSSGKTMVFISLLQYTLQCKKTAIMLVPEIGLTSQMVERLKAVFGSRIAVQHSGLNNSERLHQWQRIQEGYADIVVGTRSAVFAPLKNIGLIIMDEEQERTYHSEQAPRYSAHEVAKKRAADNGALLLLASATPSVESYYEAENKIYKLFEINERYGNAPLPAVELVDMRENLFSGNTGLISSRLCDEIEKNLECGQQTILLLNRRGYQTIAFCTECKEIVKCESCSVPMVYHKNAERLVCHHCGKIIEPKPDKCPKCDSRLKYAGYGTQKVEEELSERFATAKILRMDMDTTSKKDAHTKMLRDFAEGKYNILIGTQMVAKGLDFENVSLVGVIGIDNMFVSQSYKAFENVFSLVTQVVGRSGRSGKYGGRAVIQTLDTKHPVLQLAAQQNYKAFYSDEILFRRLNLYPPFCSICMICFTAEKENFALLAASRFAQILAQTAEEYSKNKNVSIPLRILGPAPFSVVMVNNKYRYKLTVKCRNGKSFREVLGIAQQKFAKTEQCAKASMYIDFNSDNDL